VQFALSSVLAEFLQQFFTFLFTACVVVLLGGRLTWVLIIFVPVVVMAARRIGHRVRTTTRKGQDKLAEIQNILQETITGVRIVKAFSMEAWETRRQPALGERLRAEFADDGHLRRDCHRSADPAGPRVHQTRLLHRRRLPGVHHRGVQAIRAGAQVWHLQQQLSAGAGRFLGDLRVP
jgi:ABC-type multidrug transport system fused ATPase/permease subunit